MFGIGNIKSTVLKTLTGSHTVSGLGVVAGLGKPYIKLEFDDNEALVDFQKRIQPSGEAEPVEFRDGEFYPLEGVKFTQKDFFDILEKNKEIYKYKDFTESNVLKDFGEPKQIADSKGNIKYAFVVNTPLKGSESKIYIWADLNHALFDNSTKEDRSRYWTMIKPTLERPGIVFEKGKENYFIKCFETSNGVKIYFTFIPCLINEKRLKTFYVRTNRERKKRDLFEKYKDGGLLKYWEDVTAINGADRPEDRILFVECRLYASKDDNNFSDRQIFNKNLEGLGAPGDTYIVTDTRKNPRKDLQDTAAFKKINIQKLNKEGLEYLKENDPLQYEQIKSDLDGVGDFFVVLTVNDKPAAVFNCPEALLQCKGFTPTYTRLEDYSPLIEPATGEKRLVGYGFEGATLDQLKNACKNYRQVAKLAAHLKGDTELQSAFNVWHWLHTNIKYNYDAPAQEEIRTPARTFADRESGVDCDCLAVFAACLLGAMGYKPRFEIVAFGNSPKFSHIYVNLNGAAVDRVLPVFLARPSGITKTKIMEIPVFELSGGSAMEAAATLNGIYESALAKVQAHEATAEDSANLRKSQILMTLQNSDPQAYRLAAILMPYVVAIDDDGAWYFADAKVAEIADKADKKLYELKISEVNENIFNDFFNELLNDFRNISVKVERGSGTTVLTISFNNPADDAVTITGDYVKKDFIALNPNFLTMRESLKNLLAVNYLGLASKYAVGLMTEQEAVAAGYSVETWKKAVKAFETLTRFWILVGGKAENIADIILNGSAKEPLTDKNINYEANIVATSDTDAILSGCKKRGLSGLNGLGETPTVASDIENLGEEGLEKILDWCSDIETEAEKAAENSNENPVNVLAENATPAAAASSAPAATGEKKKSLIWWLLGGAALGGGIAAATGGKKNKRRK